MLRLVVVHLFQWFKRFSVSLFARNAQQARYSRDFTRESDRGRWTFVSIFIVFTLGLYCLAGLGYFAKVNVWDGFSEEQKLAVAQAMIAGSQNLL
ncbi:hypothetical protein EGJ27_19275 [Pseudomonas sp. v388]|uniref:hypothetical protein n=1 Tax=Pseudomonas sp. v388 TaxID=2479849 RepID=UPI000F793FFA|nr:hypothetical protein [Pseudomonas sp. v388]RRV05309.1 hypothetical protein EGJ27_19275 [Pseudomonas sp. v388]